MTYQVIARKWRPQTFEEVTGQEPITRTLRGAIEHDRLHHAYLFSGARGVGKTTTARLLAKALNCHHSPAGPTPTPCPRLDESACPSCREIAEGRSIDVLEIDAASNTGVDNVRASVIDTVAVRPARDRYKVFIIDEVHMLSGAAFNALLKTLEEPPPRVIFIMATTEAHKLPDTILSRCQQFEFRTIAAAKIAERLRRIADAEGINVADEALREIARAGEGSMRDAQSAFDQVISFSDGPITVEDVETALGIAGAEMRARVMRAIAEAAPAEALAVVEDLVMRGHDLRNFCRDLLAHLRDLLIVKISGEAAELVGGSDTERYELARAAEQFSESDLVRFFHSVTETEKLLRESAHPRYQLEIGLVKLIEMRRLVPLGQIIERLAALEDSLRTGKAPAGTTGAAPTAAGGAGGGRGSSSSSSSGSGAPRRRSSSDGGGTRAGTSDVSPPQTGGITVRDDDEGDAIAHESLPHLPEAAIKSDSGLPLAGAPPSVLKLVPPALIIDEPGGLAESGGSSSSSSSDRDDASFSGAPHERDERSSPKIPAPTTVADNAVERIKTVLDDRRKPLLVVALEGAQRVRIDGEELCVEYAPEAKHLRDSLAKPDNVRILREVCREVTGSEMEVRILVREAGVSDDKGISQPDEAQRETQRLREMAENHPAVQQLLRTFRGEIVDVRRVEEP